MSYKVSCLQSISYTMRFDFKIFARFFCNKVKKELGGYNYTGTYTQSHQYYSRAYFSEHILKQ